ncbi:hypothetical protein LTR28_005735, partial [Elasticomyces elasticus]
GRDVTGAELRVREAEGKEKRGRERFAAGCRESVTSDEALARGDWPKTDMAAARYDTPPSPGGPGLRSQESGQPDSPHRCPPSAAGHAGSGQVRRPRNRPECVFMGYSLQPTAAVRRCEGKADWTLALRGQEKLGELTPLGPAWCCRGGEEWGGEEWGGVVRRGEARPGQARMQD